MERSEEEEEAAEGSTGGSKDTALRACTELLLSLEELEGPEDRAAGLAGGRAASSSESSPPRSSARVEGAALREEREEHAGRPCILRLGRMNVALGKGAGD
jgi:hypothetical protein